MSSIKVYASPQSSIILSQNNKVLNYTSQERKTNLEIEKLQTDINNSKTAITYQMVTTVCAFLAVIISVLGMVSTLHSNRKTHRFQIEQGRKQQFTNYLAQLSSDTNSIKVGAIHALGGYDEALPYIVNILKYNEDYMVNSATETVLINNGNEAVRILVEECKVIQKEKIKIAGELSNLGEDETEICEIMNIDKGELIEWKSNDLFKSAINQLEYRMDISVRSGEISAEEYKVKQKNFYLINLIIYRIYLINL
jgi:hypothetical protein